MSESTAPTSPDANATRDMVVWSDPLQTIYESFMRGSNIDRKVSYKELMEKGMFEIPCVS
jgi:hypothetical protein